MQRTFLYIVLKGHGKWYNINIKYCEISNLVSSVFLIDQNMDEKELIKRLRTIVYVLKKIKPEQSVACIPPTKQALCN